MADPDRLPRSSAPPQIDRAETAGSQRFPHSRLLGAAYWTETRDLKLLAGPWKVDALWPQHRLAVEINGHAAHSSPWAHDHDHRKEQYLIAQGLTTRRFTALQAIDEPALVIAGIAAALATQKR